MSSGTVAYHRYTAYGLFASRWVDPALAVKVKAAGLPTLFCGRPQCLKLNGAVRGGASARCAFAVSS